MEEIPQKGTLVYLKNSPMCVGFVYKILEEQKECKISFGFGLSEWFRFEEIENVEMTGGVECEIEFAESWLQTLKERNNKAK